MRAPGRRAFCVGVAALSAGAGRAAAQDRDGLEGAWGGARDALTAQVIITGGAVIGFFWRGDYTDAVDAKFTGDGRRLSFRFQGGSAILTRTGDGAARIDVTEASGVTSLDLKRD
jgi:hypothetical protein